MEKLAILALLTAKTGKDQEVQQFLKSALPLAQAEAGTTSWYAIKLDASRFAIFDTFADENGRDAHLSGEIARALFARARDLFSEPPAVSQADILAAKTL
jgi:quinol monooxygenase YgiN